LLQRFPILQLDFEAHYTSIREVQDYRLTEQVRLFGFWVVILQGVGDFMESG
jgi:hypothetical protein